MLFMEGGRIGIGHVRKGAEAAVGMIAGSSGPAMAEPLVVVVVVVVVTGDPLIFSLASRL